MIPLVRDATLEPEKTGYSKVIIWSLITILLVGAMPFLLGSSSQSTMEIENERPIADAGDDITGYLLNEEVTLDGTGSLDEEIENCTWSWESTTHPDITVSPPNSSNPSFIIADVGTITFLLTLRDPQDLSSTDQVDVIVEENQPPRVSISSPSPSGMDGPFYEISTPIEFSANGTTDPEDRPLSFNWSSNVSGQLSTKKFFTRTMSSLGWHRLTLNVSDPNDGYTVETFDIKVREDPEPPSARIFLKPSRPDLRYAKSEGITLDGTATIDPNTGDTQTTMNFTWRTNISGGMIIGYGAVLTTHLAEGHHNVTLDVLDTDGLEDSAWIGIEVFNNPPRAQISAPDIKLRAGVPTVNVSQPAEFIAGLSSDPDGDELTFHWDFGDGASETGETVIHSWNGYGAYNVTLTVDDGSRTFSLDESVFALDVNYIPVAVVDQGISVEVDERFAISANGSHDDDGDTLEYRWDFNGDGSWDSSSFSSSWTYRSEGEYLVILQVSDGFAASRAESTVSVFFPNTRPQAQIANELKDGLVIVPLSDDRGEVELDASPSIDPDDDADGDGEINGRERNNLTYSWDLDTSVDSDSDGIPNNDRDDTGKKIRLKLDDSGTLTVRLNVSDPRGLYDTFDIQVHGDNPPEALSIRIGPSTKVLVGAQVTFTGTARDDDSGETNKLQYLWDFGDGESTQTPNYQPRHTYRTDGTFEVIMTVTDGYLETQTRATVNVLEMETPQISYPSNGSQVAGGIVISGRIREVRGFEVNKVEVKIGSGEWKAAEGTTQWSYSLDTTRYGNGEIDIHVRYTVNDVSPIQTTNMITVTVQNEGEGRPEWMIPVIIGGVIALVVIVLLLMMGRRRSRGWELIAPPGPGPGIPPRIPPTVAPANLPPTTARPSLPPTGAEPPKGMEPKQAEPPGPSGEEKGPKMIRIKCPACLKVFKAVDTGERPLHIKCKHCAALGTIEKVPGDDQEEETVASDEPEKEPVEPVPIVCPVCSGLFELEEFTETAKCPMCGAEGELEEETLSELRERFDVPEPEGMTVRCPGCTGTFKVKKNDGPIICPYCGARGKASA